MKCPERESASPWPHRLAMMTVGATLLLILAGAVVTETGSGMAVPDWPTTFGYNMFLFPWAKMTGGILYEHSHRLIGSVVGLLTLTLAIGIWAIDQRRWVRWLGAAALGVVVVQGVLGGLRVVLAAEQLALLHGILAHAFLALTVSLAIFTAQGWKSQAIAVPDVEVGGFRTWSLLVVATTYLQIILGAIVTHTHGGLTLHVGVAMLLAVLVPLLTLRVCSRFSAWPKLVRPAKWLQLSWMLQMVLGMGSYVMMLGGSQIPASAFLALAFPVLHRLGGGLMLVAGLVLTLQIFRVSRHDTPVTAQDQTARQAQA